MNGITIQPSNSSGQKIGRSHLWIYRSITLLVFLMPFWFCRFASSSINNNCLCSPWNFPLGEIPLLALPSLASGNTVILKPSEVVPETGALMVKTFQKILPEGVIQVAQGSGSVGASLVSHPDIDLVAMTGSSATGRKILESAAPQLKRVILEMGGKDPMIVCADADLQKAAKDAVTYSLSNTGQVCCSVERIYVAEEVYDDFQELTKVVARDFKVGNGMDPDNLVGPMVSNMQRDLVHEQVEDAIAKGAKILHKSEVPNQSDASGSFYPVTVLADVDKNMQLFTKETFGPVVAISKFDGTEDEAVRLANDTGKCCIALYCIALQLGGSMNLQFCSISDKVSFSSSS